MHDTPGTTRPPTFTEIARLLNEVQRAREEENRRHDARLRELQEEEARLKAGEQTLTNLIARAASIVRVIELAPEDVKIPDGATHALVLAEDHTDVILELPCGMLEFDALSLVRPDTIEGYVRQFAPEQAAGRGHLSEVK